MLTDYAEIHYWLQENCSIPGTVNLLPDGRVNVVGPLDITNNALDHIPVVFHSVVGTITLSNLPNLTTLIGLPATISSGLRLEHCPALVSLVGGPAEVGGRLTVRSCAALQTLQSPLEVGGSVSFENCPALQSIAGLRGVKDVSFSRDMSAIQDWSCLPTSLKKLSLPYQDTAICLPDLPNLGYLEIPVNLPSFPAETARQILNLMYRPGATFIFSSVSYANTQTITATPAFEHWHKLFRQNNYLDRIALFEELYGEPFVLAPSVVDVREVGGLEL